MATTYSNEVGEYDERRVASLDPLIESLGSLRLPMARFRKLESIRNAIEVQLEDGGDSPNVNEYLFEALRECIYHQVPELEQVVDDDVVLISKVKADAQLTAAFQALEALDALLEREARRWRQVGMQPDPEVEPIDRIKELIEQGNEHSDYLEEVDACDCWLEAWELVKSLTTADMATIQDFAEAYDAFEVSSQWCGQLGEELATAGSSDSSYYERQLNYVHELLELFPGTDPKLRVHLKQAEGDALFALERVEEADDVFETLVGEFPDNGWIYARWSQNHMSDLTEDARKEKVESILKTALEKPELEGRLAVLDQLSALYHEWDKEAEKAEVDKEVEHLEMVSERRRYQHGPTETGRSKPKPLTAAERNRRKRKRKQVKKSRARKKGRKKKRR